jgi:hypothetical protein
VIRIINIRRCCAILPIISKIRQPIDLTGCLSIDIELTLHNLVILEIDPPVDSFSIRRKDFYLRLGFHENNYQHYHPAYRKQNARLLVK